MCHLDRYQRHFEPSLMNSSRVGISFNQLRNEICLGQSDKWKPPIIMAAILLLLASALLGTKEGRMKWGTLSLPPCSYKCSSINIYPRKKLSGSCAYVDASHCPCGPVQQCILLTLLTYGRWTLSWRPFGPLEFVLRTLWMLRP